MKKTSRPGRIQLLSGASYLYRELFADYIVTSTKNQYMGQFTTKGLEVLSH